MKNRFSKEQIDELVAINAQRISEMPYEEAMEKFETVVAALEQEGTPLSVGLKLYEIGTALSKRCAGILDATEERMLQLLGDGASATELPYDPEKDGR